MSAPLKPWEGNNLQNSTQFVRNANTGPSLPTVASRSAPVLPPRPSNSPLISNNGYNTQNSYMPYSGIGYGGYNSYGSSYGSYGMPYRSSLYNSYGSSYGGYNNYGMFGNGMYPNYTSDDHERRFIQYAEENSRNTFASVESIVRAFNSLSMMLDNTFFAMTSSFRAVLSVAENFGRLRTMFGHIWYSVNIFRFFNWLYRKIMQMMGYKIPRSMNSIAWREAANGVAPPSSGSSPGSSWPTIAFLGMLISAPYIISKFLPKYEDKGDPANWKSPGIRAKAVFDFIATTSNELTIQTNDIIILAPTYIQDEMNLKNSGWAFAVCKGKSGVVPLNYLIISKNRPINSSSNEMIPIPRVSNNNNNTKTHTKRVSFGENQIFENVDLDDYKFKEESSLSSHIKKESNLDLQINKQNLPNEPDGVKNLEEKSENIAK
ncbi:hypothetical protein NQ314_000849 [Rhamnusium bicolor]|uniref:Peroxisomal membrane protein PEX13 n=1 Tax=Rhamnusium bicolor TaxID=1586634 RepID=A0AAV8ZVX9_9CUCU|nr:hypothetical protein NQ314_000849 [Rhamnusium bicolor]